MQNGSDKPMPAMAGMALPRLEKDIFIQLTPADVIGIFRAVLDSDAAAALEILRTTFDEKIRKVLNQPHCKPMFEFPSEKESY